MMKCLDACGRRISYLRLSLTSQCNLRCCYCLPNGCAGLALAQRQISPGEIVRLGRAFAGLGFSKIRLSGGEPTLRPDLIQIIALLSSLSKIAQLALTTNGLTLAALAKPLFGAGLRGLNISLDSLRPGIFARITGEDKLDEVFDGLEAAYAAGFKWLKVNTVLLGGINDHEVEDFIEFVRQRPVTVRFIELMQTGNNRAFFLQHHLSVAPLAARLAADGWCPKPRSALDGPAVEYEHPDYLGRVGIIAPYCENYCSSCNRLRIDAFASLRLCLFGRRSFPLRPLLASDGQQDELKAIVRSLLKKKSSGHSLLSGKTGITANLAQIGG
ncbi:MAG TPA: GTP 3',8-cyclase MoaA [Oligoflexia bacterium]|nr:GTP 3',8-cyclase MoaA [Oligoflexia bacterium]